MNPKTNANVAIASRVHADQIVTLVNVKMKITKKTKLSDVLMDNPEAANLLMEAGMHCVGCPMAMQENLEMGCLAHGLEGKEIEELIKKINETQK